MSPYWPWWAGAVGLALVTIVHTLTTDRSLGVSSAWDRVLHWRSERELERLDEEFTDEQAFADALAAATAEHFGPAAGAPAAPQHFPGQHSPGQYSHAQYSHAQFAEEQYPRRSTPRSSTPGAVHPGRRPGRGARAGDGRQHPGRGPASGPGGHPGRPARLDPPRRMDRRVHLRAVRTPLRHGRRFREPRHGRSAHHDRRAVRGGILVGFGTRLAGGCSSGHGLSGCGRLRPVSLVATAVFFGTAVAVSFLLWKVI